LTHRPQRTGRNITAILLEAGVVTDEQVELGVLRQRETGLRIGETLVESGAVTEEDVGWALSRQLGLTLVDIDPAILDTDLVRSFRETLLRRSDAVPLLRSGSVVSFAVADPTDNEVIDRLEEASGGTIELCIGTPSAIRRALDAVFHAGAATAAPATPVAADAHYDVVWERSGTTFLAFHTASALKLGARAIHFVPRDGQLHVEYRQGDRLVPVSTEPIAVLDSLIARLEALGGPVLGDGVHARGTVQCSVPAGEVPIEVSLLRVEGSVHVTLQPRPMRKEVPSLDELGMDPLDAAGLRNALATGAGVVFVCGPPGSGGSTLVAAIGAASGLAGGRTVVFETTPTAPWPGAARLHLPAADARAIWSDIATAQCADIVVLDDVLEGSAIDDVLVPAASRKLLIVRTDWCDSLALIERLAAHPQGGAILAGRLLAIVQQRAVTRGPHLFEVLLGDEGVRRAIAAGGSRVRFTEAARAAGWRTLAERARERVAHGTLTDLEAARALS
jgi:hypothetical protein